MKKGLYFFKKSKFNRRLFTYFSAVVLVFGVLIALFQYHREKEFKKEKLETELNAYTELINNYIVNNKLIKHRALYGISTLKKNIRAEDLRVTVIDDKGVVHYDSFVKDAASMENHINRPEIQKSLYGSKGSNIRKSGSTGQTYYYYSKFYDKYYVRTALPFNEEVEDFLKADYVFIFVLLGLFTAVLIMLVNIADHLGKSISKLRRFAVKAAKNESLDENADFGKGELGEISNQIIKIFHNLNKTSEELSLEKEKLIKHLHISREGIGIFSMDKKPILTNIHFVEYVNIISRKNITDFEKIFELDDFAQITEFIEKYIKNVYKKNYVPNEDIASTKMTIESNGKVFLVQVVVFHDSSFEISINDITITENEKKLKQEMTINIAHELKTPVAAVSGFLETIINNPSLPEEKKITFINKSFHQINRLSLLIQDLSVLTKIDEAGNLFKVEEFTLSSIINEIIADYELRFEEKKINFKVEGIDSGININGNKFLVDSIFRNLTDNSIKYAGEGIDIKVKKYFEDENYYYFSYSDNGIGIEENHLNRIFERFYRIDKGRSRKLGGTGLGLAIVKNAVKFHEGDIYAKTDDRKGVEFSFTIKKSL